MPFTKTAIGRLACTTGLALAVLAAGATAGSGASGGEALGCTSAHAQACMTSAEYRALMLRSDALNRKYGLGTRN